MDSNSPEDSSMLYSVVEIEKAGESKVRYRRLLTLELQTLVILSCGFKFKVVYDLTPKYSQPTQ